MQQVFRLITVAALAALVAIAPSCREAASPPSSTASTPSAANVVVLVIDGPRASEAFGDPTHANVPRLWNDLRPQGTLFETFRNLGLTVTNPGHAAIATGTWQNIDNSGVNRPDRPTIFEYFRKHTGAPATDAFVISGKAKLNVIAYSTDAAYGAAYGATAHVGLAGDQAVYDDLLSVLAGQHPRLVFACFPDVDLTGHSGVFADYVAAIRNVDSLVVGVWNWIEADPFYAGKTYVFVTADHGRHDDAHGGFQHHGDTCESCRILPGLAVGPNVRVNHTVSTLYTQRDICATIGAILEVPTPQSEGYVIQEMFEPVVTGVGDER
jgi:hypothetical protein